MGTERQRQSYSIANRFASSGLDEVLSALVSIFLFGIEELATQLEEPFTILPMQAFCDKIYNWCMEIASFKAGDNGMTINPVRKEHTVAFLGEVDDFVDEYTTPTTTTVIDGAPYSTTTTTSNGSKRQALARFLKG